MVMAAPPGSAPKMRARFRLRLRCLMGRHDPAEVRYREDGSRWSATIRYCRRCRRLFDARAVRGWR